ELLLVPTGGLDGRRVAGARDDPGRCDVGLRAGHMQFLRTLRDRIRTGEITCTIRLWQRPHVHVGGRYALPPGEVQVTRLFETTLADVTPELARQSGFSSVVELLKVAKHGPGRRVFVIEFRYVGPPRHRNSNR